MTQIPFDPGETTVPATAEVGSSTNGSGAVKARADQAQAPAAALPRRSGGSPDYRLRGLQLGEPAEAEEKPREVPKNKLRRRTRRRLAVKWALVAVIAVTVAVGLRVYVVEPFAVPSAAMAPTLQAGDRIILLKGPLMGPIKAGDIVVFKQPYPYPCAKAGQPVEDLVKRVVGLPGQTVWSSRGAIYVDGKQRGERGWYDAKFGPVGKTSILPIKVPAGNYYVLGDNRPDSCDSRSFGTVPKWLVVGKVIAIVLRGDHPYFQYL